jgi:hypothetical protein
MWGLTLCASQRSTANSSSRLQFCYRFRFVFVLIKYNPHKRMWLLSQVASLLAGSVRVATLPCLALEIITAKKARENWDKPSGLRDGAVGERGSVAAFFIKEQPNTQVRSMPTAPAARRNLTHPW